MRKFTLTAVSNPLLLALMALSLQGPMPAQAGVDARMLRFPDVSQDTIAFVYAGDIWLVDKRGGEARRLSSPPGEEAFPRFSPDGRALAFSGNYDGNTDIYTMEVNGGVPARVTYHPGEDRMLDWTPDGKLLFASSRESGMMNRLRQLYVVGRAGGLPDKLPVPYGEFGSISASGTLAYTPKSRGGRTWKRYRGGMAPEVYLFDLATLESENISASDANDGQPMWFGETLYFLSDRAENQRANIWAYEGGSLRQVTRFDDFDISFPSIGPSDIVFQAGGRLYRLELPSENLAEVEVELVSDFESVRPRTENVGELVQGASLSPSGKRAVVAARGEIYTLPAENGVIRQITQSSGSAERFPAWSPDGRSLAYWSDESGEYELVVRSSDGAGEGRTVTKLGPGYRYWPYWSPDSEKVSFVDQNGTIRIVDVSSGAVTEVDRLKALLHPNLQGVELAWSSDSRWLAYSNLVERQSALFLYDSQSQSSHQVTSGYYSDSSPVFSSDGKYLYYLSNRDLSPIYSDVDATWIYPNTTRIVAAALRADVPSPLAPKNDEEEIEPEESDAEESDEEGSDESDEDGEGDSESKEKVPEPVEIELAELESRSVVLTPEPGNYTGLRAAKGKVLYHRLPRSGSGDEQRPVVFFDLEEREEKTILENARGYEISADGKKLLVAQRDKWGIVDVAPKQKVETPLRTAELETRLDPRAEWAQIFDDIWRAYRDFFYDPHMHGLDWEGLGEQYRALLEGAVTRWDVNFVLGELIGEVDASHTYVGGGDTEAPRRRQIGLLGVDWALDGGAFRIDRIVEGGAWDAEVRSPLREPGVDVSEGDYVLAVNGRAIDTSVAPFAAFEGLAGQTVALTVNGEPSLEGAREVLVETLRSESQLRHREWIERTRQRVEEASAGRIGYVFVPDTSVNGQTELVRQFGSQSTREGLIVDERWNGGGQLPDRFIELMTRRLVNRIAFRSGDVVNHPPVSHFGPKAMLINGWAGSGGDAFPYFFKHLQVGPLVGERTWGGLIGPAVGHRTIDGGFYTAPPGRIYSPGGVWFPEGIGVEPDIPVVDDPSQLARGIDPQLEAAIESVLQQLEEAAPVLPEPPVFETRTATGSQ